MRTYPYPRTECMQTSIKNLILQCFNHCDESVSLLLQLEKSRYIPLILSIYHSTVFQFYLSCLSTDLKISYDLATQRIVANKNIRYPYVIIVISIDIPNLFKQQCLSYGRILVTINHEILLELCSIEVSIISKSTL